MTITFECYGKQVTHELQAGEVAGTVIIPNSVMLYLQLKGRGFSTVWKGNGRICMRVPASDLQVHPFTFGGFNPKITTI